MPKKNIVKIGCLTQRPIQTIILMYLIEKYELKFELIIFSKLNSKSSLKFVDEGKYGLSALEYQCAISKTKLEKVNNPNSNKILLLKKKYKLDYLISFVTDTILSNKIIDSFPKGIFSTHSGILPQFRGADANKWAILSGSKYIGISLIKLKPGVDDGDIVQVKKININKIKNLKEIDKLLYYKYKIYLFRDLIINLKKNLKIKLRPQKKIYNQYFKMSAELEKKIDRII